MTLEEQESYRTFIKMKIHGIDASGRKEVQGTCPACGKEKHFYVSMPSNDSEISKFNCFKCNYKGAVTPRRLIEWGAFDSDIALLVSSHNKLAMSNPINILKYGTEIYRLNNTNITDDELSAKKLKYINERLGLELSYNDIIKNKIVLNLKDMLSENGIIDSSKYTRHENIVSQLDNYFLGFISYDNAFVNLRKLCNEGIVYKGIDKRYINYSIFGKEDTSHRFYISPTAIDKTSLEPIKIKIAEGPFDILSIKYNIDNGGLYNTIYTAIAGNAYFQILRYFICTECLMNLEIYIYIDNDVRFLDKLYKNLIRYIYPYNYPIYIHNNASEGEKDFGVPKERIVDNWFRLI